MVGVKRKFNGEEDTQNPATSEGAVNGSNQLQQQTEQSEWPPYIQNIYISHEKNHQLTKTSQILIIPLSLLLPLTPLEALDPEDVAVVVDADVVVLEAAIVPVAAAARQPQITTKAPNPVASAPSEKPPQLQTPHPRDSLPELDRDSKAHPYHQGQTEMPQRQIQFSSSPQKTVLTDQLSRLKTKKRPILKLLSLPLKAPRH